MYYKNSVRDSEKGIMEATSERDSPVVSEPAEEVNDETDRRTEGSQSGENDEDTRHTFDERPEQECPDHNTGRKKKTRTVFSRSQVFQLESTFDMKRYLSSSERAGLAASLHLTETQHNSKEFDICHPKRTTATDSKNDHEVTRRHENDYRLHETAQINTHCYNATAHALQVCREDALKIIDTCPRTDSADSCDDGSSKNKINKKNKVMAKKKTRTIFSKRQIFQLETTFDMKRYLSSAERACLANSLQLTETQIATTALASTCSRTIVQ
ncbi:hypothetical protein AAFF_G00181120 [Aldrovandia affinis]|uniref:Homeobox domain-containing protein n=1 Tax=Aldrovandia affinis TaxID=143900 RepID=A0AAD7SYD0_9TELE|nr:hypothetical protein AAFF_G00181120 [Aldrovandia affinis]